MTKRPVWFAWMASIFLLIAISFPLQIMLIYGHGPGELGAVFDKLTFLNYLVMGGLLLNSFWVWSAAPHCRWSIPLLFAAVALNNSVVGYYAIDYSFWSAHLATAGFLAFNLPLLSPKAQWLLLHPEQRWWMRAERKRINVPVTIEGTRLQPIKSQTFDISRSGAFVCDYRDAGVGDWITIRMRLSSLTQIRCQARVVRRTEGAGIYPAGVGVEFMNLTRHERRELRRHLE